MFFVNRLSQKAGIEDSTLGWSHQLVFCLCQRKVRRIFLTHLSQNGDSATQFTHAGTMLQDISSIQLQRIHLTHLGLGNVNFSERCDVLEFLTMQFFIDV